MNATERATVRDQEARRRLAEYDAEMAAMRERCRVEEAKEAEPKKPTKAAVLAAEVDLADLLSTDEAQEILARLREALCQFNAADFDVEQHIARVAVDALSAKRLPRNSYARRSA